MYVSENIYVQCTYTSAQDLYFNYSVQNYDNLAQTAIHR